MANPNSNTHVSGASPRDDSNSDTRSVASSWSQATTVSQVSSRTDGSLVSDRDEGPFYRPQRQIREHLWTSSLQSGGNREDLSKMLETNQIFTQDNRPRFIRK